MLDVMKTQLEKSGQFSVDTAPSAYSALEKLQENEYDARPLRLPDAWNGRD